jgi:CelD/BcsL family acetyltransferase involved in cellulose biosynthesis
MPPLLERGALELLWLEVRGEPVAAAYNLVWGRRVQFYQSGRKMDVPRRVRPGLVLHALAIQQSITAGRTEYDFMGGAVRYKAELATASRPLVSIRATRGMLLRDRARRAMQRGARQARAWRTALRERAQRGDST